MLLFGEAPISQYSLVWTSAHPTLLAPSCPSLLLGEGGGAGEAQQPRISRDLASPLFETCISELHPVSEVLRWSFPSFPGPSLPPCEDAGPQAF